MSIRIIDNKKVDLTDSEYNLFNKIVSSYTISGMKGEDLFVDLFETNDDGLIIFIKPPTRTTTWEVMMFLMSLMQQQHLRQMYKEVDSLIAQVKTKFELK